MDTLVGTWTWGFALGDSPNKQIITTRFDASGRRHNRVTVLSNEEFVYQDQTFDNTTYHYKKALSFNFFQRSPHPSVDESFDTILI